jgi:predicted  nucleic acid-binding Zn-ribbon protein
MHKPWDEMNSEEKANHLRGELRQMSSLYAMLSSQIQEVSRAMKALQKEIDGAATPPSP